MNVSPAVKAQAELELRRRRRDPLTSKFAPFRFDPAGYITQFLGWTPWFGDEEHPGQTQVLDAYTLALRQQHERLDYESGAKSLSELETWKPGQVIQNRIRIEAGHTVGKTKSASGIVNHFFDCFTPSIGYCFAPKWDQIHDLLFKEIKTDRRNKGLPGTILDIELRQGDDHFVKGRATDNTHGKGTEGVQGQHGKYLIFVLDEAEGVADFVFDAIDSMTSGGISIVLMPANPRTRTSRFHKAKERADTASFRMSCIYHPNVLADREIIPGAVRREYVTNMTAQHCEEVTEHKEDDHTFELPWLPGTIYRPKSDGVYMFRVRGEAPSNSAADVFMPVGRYEAAKKRIADPGEWDATKARLGIDAAGYGTDMGTLFGCYAGKVWREAQMSKLANDQDPTDYWQKTRKCALRLKDEGVTDLEIRIDAGGGFGNGVYDRLKRDLELMRAFREYRLVMVHFGGAPHDSKAYADRATEMYAHCAESFRTLSIVNPPANLEADLCERKYTWVNLSGKEVKKLEKKDRFREDQGRSPDDGDGCVLAVAPDFIFKKKGVGIAPHSSSKLSAWTVR